MKWMQLCLMWGHAMLEQDMQEKTPQKQSSPRYDSSFSHFFPPCVLTPLQTAVAIKASTEELTQLYKSCRILLISIEIVIRVSLCSTWQDLRRFIATILAWRFCMKILKQSNQPSKWAFSYDLRCLPLDLLRNSPLARHGCGYVMQEFTWLTEFYVLHK